MQIFPERQITFTSTSTAHSPTFAAMQNLDLSCIVVEQKLMYAPALRRYVTVDFYLPKNISQPRSLALLLINDGQDLVKMNFAEMLNDLLEAGSIHPVLCVGIHAGKNRRVEYGTAGRPDFAGRGALAGAYTGFVLEKLLPALHNDYCIPSFSQKAFAGFSLGGLSALDIVWNHADEFSAAGVFSGSLWWRSRDLDAGYDEVTDRIMHRQVDDGVLQPGLRFYFTTGSLDETADRNNNGIIDSIDDTLAFMESLRKKGYPEDAMQYINYEDGKHDVETWGRAMPGFLKWLWGKTGQ